MSQSDFGNLESPLSGADFINSKLEPFRDALHTTHSGTSRPSYVQTGMMWLDTTNNPWLLKVFMGSDDIILGQLSTSSLNFLASSSNYAPGSVAVTGGTINGATIGQSSAAAIKATTLVATSTTTLATSLSGPLKATAGVVSAGAIDLSGSEVTGNLGVSHLNSGSGASGDTTWCGDGTWKSRSVVGGAAATTGAVVKCTGTIPKDDTIPQQTEGTEVLTVTYTPKSASSTLVVKASFFGVQPGSGGAHLCAIFRDSTADAVGACLQLGATSTALEHNIMVTTPSGSTAATTFKLRVGGETGTPPIYVNALTESGGVGVRLFGGVAACTLEVTEYL